MEEKNIESIDRKQSPTTAKRPRRYKLYDKLKLSLHTMDIIITVVVVLLVIFVVAGIFLKI